MQLKTADSATRFLAHTAAYLLRDPAQHNLMLGIARSRDRQSLTQQSLSKKSPPSSWLSAWVERPQDPTPPKPAAPQPEVLLAALQTPPQNLLLSVAQEPQAIAFLAEQWAEQWGDRGENLPGVAGPVAEAEAFAQAWQARRGGTWQVKTRLQIYGLRAEDWRSAALTAGGELRLATPGDRALVLSWYRDFLREVNQIASQSLPELVDRGLAAGYFHLWWDQQPVGLIGGQVVEGLGRIAPVYVAPPFRGRGYGKALAAAASGQLLATGCELCCLYANLDQPIPNRIYQAIGYRPLHEGREIVFLPTHRSEKS